MPEPEPVILDNASLMIAGTELACLLNEVSLEPEVDEQEVTTMCGKKVYPGAVQWTLNATLYQSFDVDGTWDVLSAAVKAGTNATFSLRAYRDQAVSATNPEWFGEVIPRPFTVLQGTAGEPSEVELEWGAIDGADDNFMTPRVTASPSTGATAGTPGTWTPPGSTPPANAAGATSAGIVATPSASWTTGQYVQGSTAGAAGEMYWNGTAWTTGRKP
jgi:hypothetical protein